MSDERDPADPWQPPDQQPDQQPDSTGPVDVEHTRELSGSPVPPAPPTSSWWADEPTGWPATAPGPAEATGWPVPSAADAPPASGVADPAYAGSPQAAGQAGSGAYAGQAGYGAQDAAWAASQPAPTTADRRTGPGWGALVAVAAVASLVAAILGGLFGGWLGATNRVDFSSLDRGQTTIPRAGAGATARPSGSIASIAAAALPSVVTIKVKGADGAGTGSGFVIDHAGHILTNNHVVAGAAAGGSITVELSDGSQVDATVTGHDGSYDLAVIKIARTDLPPLTMGISKDVVVGDPVIAVGAPLGLESTVTSGIVSALNRPVSPGGDGNTQSFINAIQTDAAINPGNSGGPLLDMQGHVIGVNSAIARVPGTTDTQSGNIGVGFSIPSDQAVKTAEQLIKTGKAQHPVIGVVLDRQYSGAGVRILQQKTASSGDPVDPNGPAGKAGIKAGDVIVEFDGRRVNAPDDLVVAIRAKNVGDHVSMKVRRGSQTISVTLVLSGTSGS
ncbi:S1C family serine protease [Nostocoides sp. HKS02]|uniref:S1C family serine protease n=1 Tax=Nostocoides sp. HKS02 TaxID=1813880 RepID=UPI0012B4F67F|nr:trypsin-like peptidase domain-containing protein [Tetrasphaera sp. HKS02]QGN58149.1 PDZ domain-containing protein [Tetrasphaera sp. HKS02]